MAPKKVSRTALMGIGLLVIILLGLVVYATTQVNQTGTTNNGKDTTTLVSNTGTNTPPVSGTQPSSTAVSAQIWQSLYITPTQGASYWVEPSQTYVAMSIYGSQSGSGTDFSEIKTFSNEIDINPTLQGQTVSSWRISCQETIAVTDKQGNNIGYVVNGQTVNANGNTLTDGQNNYATGASVTEAQLQSILSSAGASTGNQYYIVITLSSIQLTLNFQGGGYQTLSAIASTDQNTASWLIKIS